MAEWGKISSLFRLEKVLRPEQFDATSMVTLPKKEHGKGKGDLYLLAVLFYRGAAFTFTVPEEAAL